MVIYEQVFYSNITRAWQRAWIVYSICNNFLGSRTVMREKIPSLDPEMPVLYCAYNLPVILFLIQACWDFCIVVRPSRPPTSSSPHLAYLHVGSYILARLYRVTCGIKLQYNTSYLLIPLIFAYYF
jgi:hypothetical protein